MPKDSAAFCKHRMAGLLALASFAVLAPLSRARGQKTAPTLPRTGGSISSGSSTVPRSASGNGVPFGDVPESENDLRLENLRNRAREADRQKRMVDDANRLVVLAARYRASISEHGSVTAEDTRLLLEMEKLARSVKDRMRGM